MGKIKKLLGFTAFLGATVGGVAYYKKKTGMTITDDSDFEDDLNINATKDKKVIGVSTEGSDNDNKKVTVTFNTNKAKQVVNDTLDDIGDAMFTAKDKIVDTIGEEHIESAKETAAKVKDKLVDTIGEDNITKAKSKIGDVADKTKEKAGEIFTEENFDLAKDKVSDAFDKTKDVIKKATDKVKSAKDTVKDDFEELDELDALDDLDASDVFEELKEAQILDGSASEVNTVETVADSVPAPQAVEEPVVIDSISVPESPVVSDTPVSQAQPSVSTVPEEVVSTKPKDADVSRYDFLADEVDDL